MKHFTLNNNQVVLDGYSVIEIPSNRPSSINSFSTEQRARLHYFETIIVYIKAFQEKTIQEIRNLEAEVGVQEMEG